MTAPSSDLQLLWASLGIPPDWVAAHGLPVYVEAQALELVEIPAAVSGKTMLLSPAAANAWQEMQAAAESDGVSLLLISAWRSIARQAELINNKLAQGMSIDAVLQRLAPPGCSEHHTGRAIDIATSDAQSLTEAFSQTPAFAWLTANAGRFGFTLSFPQNNPYGYMYEPWHWCFQV
ncbi:M15 family metallopeptidase [Silvimonas sp.]|uniref:M15 family metallopeptidase n=1 Tax=Silvimonas sp. TaxID=2650811 RepID=UPI00284647C4|nr:M15 family metallopeptidase [Silvimonas sp.]MDR3429811.1 M15 family metallopeptidase [Silvimonas sp.]